VMKDLLAICLSLFVMSALPILPSPLKTHTRLANCCVLYCMSTSKHVKIQNKNTTYSSAPYPPLEVGTAVIGRVCSVTKTVPLFITHTLLLLVLSCVTILNNSQNTGVCFVARSTK
jgi:hypothetical protein